MSYTLDNLKEFQSNIIKPNETLQFDCKMCGDCCRRRNEPIILTGLDIFRIAQALGVYPAQVIEEKTISYIGDQSHVPVITLKERLDGSCSLLRNGKCMVHSSKPVVCALYPLGRMYNTAVKEYQYFRQTHSCQTGIQGGKTWTLQEWLDEFKISQLDQASIAWTKLLLGTSIVTGKIDKNKIPEEMIAAVGSCLYLNYDIAKPYVEQVELNMRLLQKIFKDEFGEEINYNI